MANAEFSAVDEDDVVVSAQCRNQLRRWSTCGSACADDKACQISTGSVAAARAAYSGFSTTGCCVEKANKVYVKPPRGTIFQTGI